MPVHPKPTPPPAIAKTRQPVRNSSRKEPAAFPPTIAPPRGVLTAAPSPEGKFFHLRLSPPLSLAPWVQHFWMVEWDLRGLAPQLQETLPHPNVYLVFEQELDQPRPKSLPQKAAEVSGVSTGKFSRTLEGHARVFGVKFKAGGFRTFLDHPVSTITDRVLPAQQIFGPSVLTLAAKIYRCSTPEEMAELTGKFLTARKPASDDAATLSARLVDLIFENPGILTVNQLATRAGIGVRSLQRLFNEYVGVSPKWVIRRYRLHELVERLHSGQPFDGAGLALDLGYSDQAHLINDFRKLVGYTPTGYRKRSPGGFKSK